VSSKYTDLSIPEKVRHRHTTICCPSPVLSSAWSTLAIEILEVTSLLLFKRCVLKEFEVTFLLIIANYLFISQ
jgi:hypothetical protein